MRRFAIAFCLLAAALAAVPAAALASKLVTWTTESRFVDPAEVPFNEPPSGTPALSPALRVNVLLPDGFTRERRYPVLYLLHNLDAGFRHWASPQGGNVSEVAAGFPGIIVMPEGDRGWYANWWNGGRRGGPAWERYHLDELMPLVHRRLPIRPGRRWHAIAGPSMGGEGAMFYASQRPHYFGAAASFSGSLSIQRPHWPQLIDSGAQNHIDLFGDPEDQRFYWTGHNPTALVENLRRTRLYVTAGDGTPNPASQEELGNTTDQLAEVELRQHAEDFVRAARATGTGVTYVPRQGIHDWPYWRQHLAALLDWGLFEPVTGRPGDWRYETVASVGKAWGLRFRFSPAPEAVNVLTLKNGRALSGRGSGRATITTRSGCRFSADMAAGWTVTLPRGFRKGPRSPAGRKRASARCGRLTPSSSRPPAAQAGQRADYRQTFTTRTPGAPAGVDTRILYKHPDDPDAKPIPVRREVFIFPRGTRWNGAIVPDCTASEQELQTLGEMACPAESRIGAGRGTFMTGFPPDGGETPMEVDIFDASSGFLVLGGPEGESPLRFATRGRRKGRVVTVDVPRPPGGPPEGESVLRKVHNVIGAHSRGRRTYMRTPRVCPPSGVWTFRARFTFADGVVENDVHRMRCRRT